MALGSPPIKTPIIDAKSGYCSSEWSRYFARLYTHIGGSSGTFAPVDATYIVQTPNTSLTTEQALSTLSTGFMKVATGTGVISSTGSDTVLTADIGDDQVTFTKIQNISSQIILGRNTASSGDVEELSATTTKTILNLSNVENTALSTWAGSANITTLGTVATGTWAASTISVSTGGTGQTTYTDGQLLIGNSSGNTLTKATITAGSGISVTNGNGSITIEATGGSFTAATQAEQETGTSTAVGTTPGRQHYHPSASKFWVDFTGSDGSINASYNVSSVTRSSAGNYTVNLTTSFSSTSFCAQASCSLSAGAGTIPSVNSKTAGSITIETFQRSDGSDVDPTNVYLCGFGDQS